MEAKLKNLKMDCMDGSKTQKYRNWMSGECPIELGPIQLDHPLHRRSYTKRIKMSKKNEKNMRLESKTEIK